MHRNYQEESNSSSNAGQSERQRARRTLFSPKAARVPFRCAALSLSLSFALSRSLARSLARCQRAAPSSSGSMPDASCVRRSRGSCPNSRFLRYCCCCCSCRLLSPQRLLRAQPRSLLHTGPAAPRTLSRSARSRATGPSAATMSCTSRATTISCATTTRVLTFAS